MPGIDDVARRAGVSTAAVSVPVDLVIHTNPAPPTPTLHALSASDPNER